MLAILPASAHTLRLVFCNVLKYIASALYTRNYTKIKRAAYSSSFIGLFSTCWTKHVLRRTVAFNIYLQVFVTGTNVTVINLCPEMFEPLPRSEEEFIHFNAQLKTTVSEQTTVPMN